MIEVRKYIPQVYNQSRDFSVFMGAIQILLNELDVKGKVLESLPVESLLPYNLSQFPEIKSKFRSMLKRKGSIMCILYAITLSGGFPPSFEEETQYLNSCGFSDELVNRESSSFEEIGIDKESLVYYFEREGGILKLHINIKDLSKVNQGLLNELWYYLKPVNTIVLLEQYKQPSISLAF